MKLVRARAEKQAFSWQKSHAHRKNGGSDLNSIGFNCRPAE
jgi:hypothetical protein